MSKTPGTLSALFPKTRQGILSATLIDPAREWYLSDLAKHLGVPPSSLQRELASLVRAGILRRREDGNRTYYRADADSPLFPELRGIVLKTAGLRDVLRKALAPLADRIAVAFVYGSMARAEERSASDVDLMVIGDSGLADLAPALKRAEETLGRPVNPTVYGRAEIVAKLRAGHHFLENVLGKEKLFIVGGKDDLAAALGTEPSPEAHDEQAGA